MKSHPYAEIFPLLDGTAFEELVLDIKAHGLREKIWTHEGKILDGRNRFNACQRAKVKPEFREYKGKDALAFVISLNIQRRHLTDPQRAMAAARIATLRQGGDPNAPRGALTQAEAAEAMDTSRRSVQRAKKVVEQGSKALQRAVETGDVPLNKAAAVVALPKSEQLAAAKESTRDAPAPQPHHENRAGATIESAGESHAGSAQSGASLLGSDEPECPDDMEELDRRACESFDREREASINRWLEADDKLAAAQKEIDRQAAEIVALKTSRDGEMNRASEAIKLVKQRDRVITKLEKELEKAKVELEKLRERIAVMEAA